MKALVDKKADIFSTVHTDFGMACSCHTTQSYICILIYANGVSPAGAHSLLDPYVANKDTFPPTGACDGSVSAGNANL